MANLPLYGLGSYPYQDPREGSIQDPFHGGTYKFIR